MSTSRRSLKIGYLNSAVIESGLLTEELDWAKKKNTKIYRSKEKKNYGSPWGSYMMNKKWILKEEFNNHMLRFQQVKLRSIHQEKFHFDFPGWIGGL